jgi:hypothetical protein
MVGVKRTHQLVSLFPAVGPGLAAMGGAHVRVQMGLVLWAACARLIGHQGPGVLKADVRHLVHLPPPPNTTFNRVHYGQHVLV